MRKTLSLILAAVLIITSLSVLCITTLAEDTDYTVYETATLSDDIAAGTVALASANRLDGTLYFINTNGVSSEKAESNNYLSSTGLHDGDFVKHLVYWNGLKGAFILELGRIYDINQFVVTTYESAPVTSFEIYVGNDRDNLCIAENLVAKHTRTDDTVTQFVITLNDSATVSGLYMGVKVVDTLKSATTKDAVLCEIGAYGTVNTEYTNLFDGTEYNYPNAVSLNYLQKPIEYINKSGTVTENLSATRASDHSTLEWTDGYFMNDTWYSYMANSKGGKFTYDLKDTFAISSVLLSSGNTTANGTNGSTATAWPYEAEWKVYISNNKEDLYSIENCYGYVVDNPGSSEKTSKMHYVEFDTAIEGRYVGFETLGNTNSSNAHTFVNEFAIYGTDTWTTESDAKLTKNPGDNLIYGLEEFYIRSGDKAPSTENKNTIDRSLTGSYYVKKTSEDKDNNNSTKYGTRLNNNSFTDTNVIIWNAHNDRYVTSGNANYKKYYSNGRLLFDLGEGKEATVGSVLVQGGTVTTDRTHAYRAYVGNDAATLFSNENLVVIYDGQGSKSGLAIADAAHQKTGRYMGILFTGGSQSSLVTTEIAFYAPDKAKGKAVTETPAEPLNVGSDLYSGSDRTAGTTVITTDNNNQPVERLTNNYFLDASNVSAFGGNGLLFWNGATRNFAYDLGKAADISRILIAGGKKTSGDNTMALKAYGVYLSNDKDTLFNIENQVSYLYNEDNSQAHIFDVSSIEGQYQYVGFMMYGLNEHYATDATAASSSMWLSEFAVYGNYATNAYTVTANPDTATLTGLGSNGLAGASLDNADIDNTVLTDGTVYDENAVTLTTTDDESNKLTYTLAGTQTVNQILVGGLYDYDSVTAPLHYKVYASESADTLWDSAVVDYYVTDYEKGSGSYAGAVKLFNLAAPVTAKYIGIEFLTGSSTREFSITELAVYSTVELALDASAQITDAADIDSIYVDGMAAGDNAVLGSDILTGNHSIVVYGADGSSDVYLAADGTITLKTELKNAFSTTLNTEIRTDAPVGIRFITDVALDAKAKADEIGTVIAKWQDLDGTDLVRGADYKLADAIAYEKGKTDVKYGEDTAEVSHISVTLHNIDQKKYLNYYVVRPYLTVTDGDVTYIVYGMAQKTRPVDVANEVSADSASQSTAALAWANEVIDGSDISVVNDAYAASYNITPEMLSASVVTETVDNADYTPNLARLKTVIKKAQRGEDLVIATIGGSITEGAGANPKIEYNWSNQIREWFANTFGVNVKLINAGVSATGTGLGVYRIEKEVLAYNPDLVIVEYAVNDNPTAVTDSTFAMYEAIVRKVLSSSTDTALMQMFMIRYKTVDGALSFYNAQEMQSKIGGHYGVPMISFYDAVIDILTEDQEGLGTVEGDYWNLIMADTVHPNNYGHRIAASLITDYLADVVKNVDSITDTASDTLPDIITDSAAGLYEGTSTLYSSVTLPDEYVVSYGSYKVVHDADTAYGAQGYFADAWYAENQDGETMQPMKLSIPAGRTVSVLILRKDDSLGVGARCEVTAKDGTYALKGLQNHYSGYSGSYADSVICYTNTTSQALDVTITPVGDAAGEYSLILGIMISE